MQVHSVLGFLAGEAEGMSYEPHWVQANEKINVKKYVTQTSARDGQTQEGCKG